MTTNITATFNDGDESTVRTLTLPHDVSDRVGELIGLGMLCEQTVDCDAFNVEVHRDGATPLPVTCWTSGMRVAHDEPIACRSGTIERVIMVAQPDPASNPVEYLLVNIDGGGQWFWPSSRFRPVDATPASAETCDCEYAVGDTIEVVDRPGGHDYGPPVGHRAVVVEVSDFHTLCIPWDGEGPDGFWLSYGQVRRVNEPVSARAENVSASATDTLARLALDRWEPTVQLGDIIEITVHGPSTRRDLSLPLGHRAAVTAIDDTDPVHPVAVEWGGRTLWLRHSEFKPVQILKVGDTVEVIAREENDPPLGHRSKITKIDPDNTVLITWGDDYYWMRASEVRRVDTTPASPWSAPTVAPDGTKTFTAPGATMVEHPPGPGEDFPTWTITTDASLIFMESDAALSTSDFSEDLRWRDALRDSAEMLSRMRHFPGQQSAHEIETLIDRCREALEDA